MKTITLELTEERLFQLHSALRAKTDIDSIDEVELIMEAEKIFGVEIPDVGDSKWME